MQEALLEKPTRVASEAEAQEVHEQVLEKTRTMLRLWMIVISVNFLTHFMRVSVALTYMTSAMGASELHSGMVVTLHMTIIGFANAYLSCSMDSHSFESMITTRLSLLTLATLGEWLAQSFLQFAAAYILASLAIIWVAVADGYFVTMVPSDEAKRLQTWACTLDRTAIMLGMGLGGCIGGLLSLRAVFFGSFVVSVMSLLFILTCVVGREQDIRQQQSDHINQIYDDFPHLFDPSQRFPLPFVEKRRDDDNGNYDESMGVPMGEQGSDVDFYCSLPFIPLVLFLINVGMRTSQNDELIAWWNVYATQVMGQSISESSMQMVLAYVFAVPTMAIVAELCQTHAMSLPSLMKWSIIVYTLSGFAIAALFGFVFPRMSFDWFWFGMSLRFVLAVIPDPFRLALQVVESPPHRAGSISALFILSRSLIPAMQHVIIGALWNQGGPKHPWFFWWFAILNAGSTLVFIAYWFLRRFTVFSNQHTEYQTLL